MYHNQVEDSDSKHQSSLSKDSSTNKGKKGSDVMCEKQENVVLNLRDK
jgi:hypothetical protein